MTKAWAERWVGIVALSVCCTVLATASWALRPEQSETRKPLTRGFHQLEFATDDGGTLRCSLWVPPLEDGSTVPLVVALHYGGEVTRYYSMGFIRSLVVPGMKTLGAIIVAPDCPGNGWTDPISERSVLALTQYAIRHWPVDRRRVVVTGYSLGGIGTWFLASRHPEIFSAAVPVAGRPVGDAEIRVPVYAINGRRDEVIDLEPTRRVIEALRAKGARVELIVVKGPTHYQTEGFVAPLKEAVTWLRQLWEMGS